MATANTATRKYETAYSIYLATVAAGERAEATVEEMEAARHALASRRDRLGKHAMHGYAAGRVVEMADLAASYDALVARLMAAGAY